MNRLHFIKMIALGALAVPVAAGCAAFPGGVAAVPVLVDKAAQWLSYIDDFVTSLLSLPVVTPEFREKYEKIKIELSGMLLEMRALIAKGEDFYAEADAVRKRFLERAKVLLKLLSEFNFLDAQGNLKAPDGSVQGVRLQRLED